VLRIDLDQSVSTSVLARQMLVANQLDQTTLITAKIQTGGIGTFGRAWHSPPGGLWTTLAHPLPHAQASPSFAEWTRTLGLRVGWACRAAVQWALDQASRGVPGQGSTLVESTARAQLKLPNDVLLVRAESAKLQSMQPTAPGEKVAGVLTELVASPAGQPWALVGVGINANIALADLPVRPSFPATSLLAHTGHACDLLGLREALVDRLLVALDAQSLTSAMLADLSANLAWRGAWVEATEILASPSSTAAGVRSGTALAGRFAGLDDAGCVLVEPAFGPLVTLSPGARLTWSAARS
jgi:BirA family biotin operon repressor/biotin-[acetyl-CoA-carboxylase] ligase